MARLLRPIQKPLLLNRCRRHRPYVSSPSSSLDGNLLRILNNELTYLSDYRPPLPPPSSFRSFSIEDRPGEQWIRLKSYNPYKNEEVKVDASMFDGMAPIPQAKKAIYEGEVRLHVSLVVEVSKGEDSDSLLVFVCSAWPESIEVQQVFPIGKRTTRVQPYMGRNFKELSKDVQNALVGYLEEREVDDELAGFLHQYIANKDKAELLRWMKTVESYVQK